MRPVVLWRASRYEWLFAAGLALLLGLLATAINSDLPLADATPLAMQPLPATDGKLSQTDEGGHALVIPGGGREQAAARLRFTLPAKGAGDSGWAVCFERAPIDSLSLQGTGWRSQTLGFFKPRISEGPLPTLFVFDLPEDASGEMTLDLHASAEGRTLIRPMLMSAETAAGVQRRGTAISAMIYACRFTLALLALALFWAARDRLFLLFFGCAISTLLALAAFNGDLYQTSGLGWLGGWGLQGLLALVFLACASALQTVQRYAGTHGLHAGLAQWIDRFGIALVLLAALCLLDLKVLSGWLRPVALLGAVLSLGIAALLILDAARRRIPMAAALATIMAITLIVAMVVGWGLHGQIDLAWAQYGCQIALLVVLSILAVGLIARISEFRDQRDLDRLARIETEQRMRREATRAEINNLLQAALRGRDESDIPWVGFRILLDHLAPLLRTGQAILAVRGYLGEDVQLVLPAENKPNIEASLAARELTLRRWAANGIPMQQPVTTGSGGMAMEAILPLPIRAPAWGVLLLERGGSEGFSSEEMALAGDFLRATIAQIEQAMGDVQLRRSAELDALTGTLNRRTIGTWVARAFRDAIGESHPISVLFVDLDRFKNINDTWGHACGDHCLREVARTLHTALGQDDLFGRYGGEEFIAVLPGRNGAAARVVAETLRAAVEGLAIDWDGHTLHLTVSVGVATRLEQETQPAETIARADKALYAAKNDGRNCVQVAPAVFS